MDAGDLTHPIVIAVACALAAMIAFFVLNAARDRKLHRLRDAEFADQGLRGKAIVLDVVDVSDASPVRRELELDLRIELTERAPYERPRLYCALPPGDTRVVARGDVLDVVVLPDDANAVRIVW